MAVGHDPFARHGRDVHIDLLTHPGTDAMSIGQRADLLRRDGA